MSTEVIVQGYIDPVTGLRCAWANFGGECPVPDCDYPNERCVCVKAERGEVTRKP